MSTIQDADLFLVERGGVSYKLAADDFSTKLQDNDQLLVQRAGVSYKMSWSDKSKLQDTDLLLVERSGVSYKVTWGDMSNIVGVGDVGVFLYNGTSGSIPITTGFPPGLVWIKCRTASSGFPPDWYDISRGPNDVIFSNSQAQETTYNDSMSAFGSTSFTVGPDPQAAGTNRSGQTFVAWVFGTSHTSSTNNNGSIQSTVYTNSSNTFSIVRYIGNNTAGSTVGHGLSKAPDAIIWKRLQTGDDWMLYNSALGANVGLTFPGSGAANTSNGQKWNSTSPSDTVFTLGPFDQTNKNGEQYVAYCWAAEDNRFAVGTYLGNGSTNGPTVNIGWKPGILMIKESDGPNNYGIWDIVRDPTNPNNQLLFPNLDNSTSTGAGNNIDFLDTGFQLKGTDGVSNEQQNYVYWAWAITED
jgi:hypothetical protein